MAVNAIAGGNDGWSLFRKKPLQLGQGQEGQGQAQGLRKTAEENPQAQGLRKTAEENPQVQQPNLQLGTLGGVTLSPHVNGVEGVNPLAGIARTEHAGHVQGTDGSQISIGGQGVGFGQVFAQGEGEHYDNGLGHSKHTKWWAA